VGAYHRFRCRGLSPNGGGEVSSLEMKHTERRAVRNAHDYFFGEENRPPELRIALDDDEICVDYFAGGGGASTGMDEVLALAGRHVNIAVNHDGEAIALHKANHPQTEHYVEDVFQIDIVKAVRGRRIGFAWYSPDCTYHSKARGGKPFRDRNKARRVRGLAWVIHKHIKQLGPLAPRIVACENVQEFLDWGPLDEEGKIIKLKKGLTFRRWCKQLANLGYTLDMWTLKGCDYGAPTTRERLFIVARRDGLPIVKPAATHGPGLQPYRTAADCIDFSLPCRSIFNRKKPLADNTMRRIAEGIKRFVVNNPKPFIIPVAHAGDSRSNSIDEPLRTVTAGRRGDFALVDPIVVGIDNKSNGGRDVWPSDAPLRTVTTENRFAVATPMIVRCAHGERDANGKKRGKGQHQADLPLPTQTASKEFAVVTAILGQARERIQRSCNCGHVSIVEALDVRCEACGELDSGYVTYLAPLLVPRYGEDPSPTRGGGKGQAPRTRSVELPLPTIVTTDNGAQLVEAFLLKQNGVDEKMVIGQNLDQPVHTITTKDQKAVVTATLIHNTTGNAPTSPDRPLKTVTTGGQHMLATSHLLKFKGTSKDGQPVDVPLHTVQAEGTHYAEVRAFLIKYYSEGGQWGSLNEPIGTITTKDRIGLVTIHGEDYVIIDIGLRMLTPRELYRAQGFPDDYIIDVQRNPETLRDALLDGGRTSIKKARRQKDTLTKTAQVRMCGNSVCPPVAKAVIAAQLGVQDLIKVAA
jgi:DNA (cytosine-5)-methyltransferase 1